MNRNEAKYILGAYHLGGQDAGDPQFQEALELVENDPPLASWFANEQAIDVRVSEKFRSFPVPPDLKTQLLAARKIIPLHPWWKRPAWASAAACLMLFLVSGAWFFHLAGQPGFAQFRSYVAETAAGLEHLDLLSTNLVEVKQWLLARNAPGDFVVPPGLKGRPSIGCRTFSWNGQTVSLVCFNIDNFGTVHLFVIDRSTLHNAPAGIYPEFAVSDRGITTASWSNRNCAYVLASKQNKEDLRRLLQSRLSGDAFVNALAIANGFRLAAPPVLRTPFSAQSYSAGAIFASAQQPL